MRINTRVVIDMETLEVLERESYEYEGPIALCGGGPSAAQNNAAQAQANLSGQLGDVFGKQFAFQQAQQGKVNPFYTGIMQNGLPYYNNLVDSTRGNVAQAFAPARQQLGQQLMQQGGRNLPSGFATQAMTDLNSQQARAFDQGLTGAQGQNFQAQGQGAAGLLGQAQLANPTAYSGQALQGNSSIMNAPLSSPGLSGLLGGLGGGLLSALPF